MIKARGTTSVESGDRVTLLRDADGDGEYELQTVFAEDLNAPYGLAFHDGNLYVANQDALVRFDYQDGQTEASGPPTQVAELPSEINHHWTKALTISPDGQYLYVGIGSNSNITERGMEAEIDRAMVWQINADTGAYKPYATGLRNPTALAIQPGSGQLWAVVNERDELGEDLAPDYLTSVRKAASTAGLTPTGARTSMTACARRTRTRSPPASRRTTPWARTSPHWAWIFRPT